MSMLHARMLKSELPVSRRNSDFEHSDFGIPLYFIFWENKRIIFSRLCCTMSRKNIFFQGKKETLLRNISKKLSLFVTFGSLAFTVSFSCAYIFMINRNMEVNLCSFANNDTFGSFKKYKIHK